MNSYPSYKDSGMEWIGEIPSDWGNTKIKYVGDYINGFPFKPSQWGEKGRLIIRIQNLTKGNSTENYFDGELEDRYIIKKGDLLFSWSTTLGLFEWDREDGLLNQHIFKVVLNNIYIKGYFIHLFSPVVNYLQSQSHGSTMTHLTKDNFGKVELPLPPLPEQTQIVSFLDTKTQKIDELIEQTEQKIELLIEKRTSLINHCVTKGLNPNMEMKDSGVEWIGEIPSHWDFIPTKYFTVHNKGIQTGPFGTQLNTKDYVDNGVKVMNQKTLIDEDYDIGEEFISYEKYQDLKVFEVLDGDIIMGTRGSFGKGKRTTFGKVSIVPKGLGDCVLHPCLIRIRLKENLILKNYYYFYINDSTFFLDDIRNTSNSTTIEVIYGVTLKDIRIPIPPIEEQNQILIYINKQTQKIDTTIEKETQRIELLKEYRQSLISEVVTGKIDVRDYNG